MPNACISKPRVVRVADLDLRDRREVSNRKTEAPADTYKTSSQMMNA